MQVKILFPNPCFGIYSFIILCFSPPMVSGQSCFGIGIGTENLHINAKRFGKLAPQISYEYLRPDMRHSYFISAYCFNNKDEPDTYSYTHILLQLGFKKLFGGDADKKSPVFFAGGGLSDCISLNKYKSVSGNTQETVNSFGLGFMGGMQYYLKPIVVALKMNLDLFPKPFEEYGGDSYVHTGIGVSFLLPLHPFN